MRYQHVLLHSAAKVLYYNEKFNCFANSMGWKVKEGSALTTQTFMSVQIEDRKGIGSRWLFQS